MLSLETAFEINRFYLNVFIEFAEFRGKNVKGLLYLNQLSLVQGNTHNNTYTITHNN